MTVKYDIEKLARIVRDIQTVMKISLSVLDKDEKLLLRGKNEDEFCNRINQTPEGRGRCECSDSSLIKLCAERGEPVSHICHAGILDTAVPIIKDGIVAGYIFIGRIRPYPRPENISDRLSWLGDSPSLIEERYEKLTYFTEEQLRAVISLISNLIFDSAIEIVYDDLMESAEDYIRKNLDRPLDVATLCEKLYVSKNKLYEAFKTHRGKTVNDYVWSERLRRAKQLLKTTTLGISEISSAVGIENSAYFCKIFKSETGLSPSAYRKINLFPKA